jgi:WD40 repeat protein
MAAGPQLKLFETPAALRLAMALGGLLMIGAAPMPVPVASRPREVADLGAVVDLALSPDDRSLLAPKLLSRLLLRTDARTGKVSEFSAPRDYTYRLGFLPDGKQALVGGYDQKALTTWLVLVNPATGATDLTLNTPPDMITALRVAPDGRHAAVATARNQGGPKPYTDCVVHIYDLSTGKALLRLEDNEDQVTGLVFTPDSKRLVTNAPCGQVRVWEVSDGKLVASHKVPRLAQTPGVLIANGKQAVFASERRLLWVDLTSGKVEKEAKGEEFGFFTQLATVGRSRIVAASMDVKAGRKGDTVYLFEAETAKAIRAFPHDDLVNKIAVTADGKRMYTHGYKKGKLHVWDIEPPVADAPPKP